MNTMRLINFFFAELVLLQNRVHRRRLREFVER